MRAAGLHFPGVQGRHDRVSSLLVLVDVVAVAVDVVGTYSKSAQFTEEMVLGQ